MHRNIGIGSGGIKNEKRHQYSTLHHEFPSINARYSSRYSFSPSLEMYSILIERKRNEPEDEDARYPRWTLVDEMEKERKKRGKKERVRGGKLLMKNRNSLRGYGTTDRKFSREICIANLTCPFISTLSLHYV